MGVSASWQVGAVTSCASTVTHFKFHHATMALLPRPANSICSGRQGLAPLTITEWTHRTPLPDLHMRNQRPQPPPVHHHHHQPLDLNPGSQARMRAARGSSVSHSLRISTEWQGRQAHVRTVVQLRWCAMSVKWHSAEHAHSKLSLDQSRQPVQKLK